MKLLVAQRLTKTFGGIVANKSVSFDIEPREVHAVIGPNGAGKSTFMAQLSGELLPDEGSIEFDGNDVTRLPIHRRAKLGLGRCYQVSRVFLDHSVIENVSLGVLARQGGHLRAWRNARTGPGVARTGTKHPRRYRTCRTRACAGERFVSWRAATIGTGDGARDQAFASSIG